MIDEADRPDGRADRDVARDWITIWESECAALAADREMRDCLTSAASHWGARAREAAAWAELARLPVDAAARGVSGAGPQARAAATTAASHARDATLHVLAGRVAELERRLAGMPANPGATFEP